MIIRLISGIVTALCLLAATSANATIFEYNNPSQGNYSNFTASYDDMGTTGNTLDDSLSFSTDINYPGTAPTSMWILFSDGGSPASSAFDSARFTIDLVTGAVTVSSYDTGDVIATFPPGTATITDNGTTMNVSFNITDLSVVNGWGGSTQPWTGATFDNSIGIWSGANNGVGAFDVSNGSATEVSEPIGLALFSLIGLFAIIRWRRK